MAAPGPRPGRPSQERKMAGTRIGSFDFAGDVGPCRIAGETAYDPAAQSYALTGGGSNMWGPKDEFHFASRGAEGDFMLTAEASFLGPGVNAHRKWGLMLRSSREGDSPYADAAVHGDGLLSLQYRLTRGAETLQAQAAMTAPDVVQLERSGRRIVMRAAHRGEALAELASVELDLPAKLLAGIFVCSHAADAADTAIFRNLRFDVAAPAGTDGDRNPAASRLEILEVDTGLRRIVYSSPRHFEAPNWSRDGSYLLYNEEGQIYRIPLEAGGRPILLDTGKVRANNNDHGISFDGRLLALSSHTDEAGRKSGSQIYVVPIQGGEPRKVTDDAPSYWHGWSPDGGTLVYCAERGGNYDVYSIPSKGGPESRLTTDPGLDDGPEFSPDGAYVYFNSTRSGRMKIWRMRPDGSGQERVSPADDWNDWFAHLSPDGSRMLYVSYPSSVPAAMHPRNQRVVIREQETATGKARVVAGLYGGQGTMNVPSWSPDGARVAFVSYTYGDPSV
jgi:TolB protein